MFTKLITWLRHLFTPKKQTLYENLASIVRAKHSSRIANTLLQDLRFKRHLRNISFAYEEEWNALGKLSPESRAEVLFRMDMAAQRWALKQLSKISK